MTTTYPIDKLFSHAPELVSGVYVGSRDSAADNQMHTNAAFSEKWLALEQQDNDADEAWKQFQLDWYLKLYGYADEAELAQELKRFSVILDAGCGLGYKAAWFAKLAPDSTVIAMDFSEAVFRAAQRYSNIGNMLFVKGDIADTGFRNESVGLVSCDQVLHHTESPPQTLREFARITPAQGKLNTYVYAKKALPRELLDEHFRSASKALPHTEIWEMSQQLTTLGKQLAELNIELDFPDIPALGIRGGKQDLQRFIYWNFVKCFWNESMGEEVSVSTNFDWYSPSNAFRYDKDEFLSMCIEAGWKNEFLHSEEACWSGRFHK